MGFGARSAYSQAALSRRRSEPVPEVLLLGFEFLGEDDAGVAEFVELFQECHDLFGRGGLDGRDGLEAIRLLYRGPGLELPCCRCRPRMASERQRNLAGVRVAAGIEVAGFVDLPFVGGKADPACDSRNGGASCRASLAVLVMWDSQATLDGSP